MNLYDFLKGNQFQGLSLNLIRRFAIQILQTLVLLQETKIIHCDLKPENILLRQPNRSAIKVIDFGSSCFSDKRIYTYIQSRFYRAPEIILGIPYTHAIDMWSFGCILVELFTGFPVFPGESELEQLLCIMEYLGTPSVELLQRSTRKKLFFDSDNQPKTVLNSKGKKRSPGARRFTDTLRNPDEKFLRVVESCFVWEPSLRLTPQQALASDWITENYKNKEPTPKNSEKKPVSTRGHKSFLFT
jgi:dual specificity tyrosine-phosphorylation-regulated kinase 2/3/4